MADPDMTAAAKAAREAEKRAEAARAEAQRARDAAQASSVERMPELRVGEIDPTPAIKAAEAQEMAQRQAEARKQSADAALQAERSIKAGLSPVNQADFIPPAQLADTARIAGAAASSLAPGMGAAPGSTTPAGAAADVARLSAAPKVEPTGLHSPAIAPPEPKPEAVNKATAAVVGAAPDRVAAVIDKLKKEEAKGGPGLWDVIEAAAAGWHGKVPLYVQKQLEAAAEEARTEQIKTTASLQAAIEAEQQAEAYKRQQALQAEGYAQEKEIARMKLGIVPGLAGADISPLALGLLGGK